MRREVSPRACVVWILALVLAAAAPACATADQCPGGDPDCARTFGADVAVCIQGTCTAAPLASDSGIEPEADSGTDAAASCVARWRPASGIEISADGLGVLSSSDSPSRTSATVGHTQDGKYYLEVEVAQVGTLFEIGLTGVTQDGVLQDCAFASDGSVRCGGAGSQPAAYGDGTTVGLLLDLTEKRVHFTRSGVTVGSAETSFWVGEVTPFVRLAGAASARASFRASAGSYGAWGCAP